MDVKRRYLRDGGRGSAIYRSNKLVAAPRHGLDESGIVRIIAEHVTQSLDRCIQAVLAIHKRTIRPQTRSKLFPRQKGFASLEEKDKNLKRLLLDPDLHPGLAQFVRPKINFEDAKLNYGARDLFVHSRTSPGSLPSTTLQSGSKLSASVLTREHRLFAVFFE